VTTLRHNQNVAHDIRKLCHCQRCW